MTTAVTIAPSPILQFLDNNGRPCVGGSVLTQVGGVNTATYQDSAGTIPLPNPIPLNNRGEISNASGVSCQLFLQTGVTYTFTLSDAGGNLLNQASYVATSNALALFIASLISYLGTTLIGFMQAGVGAIYRLLQDELRESVKVTQFGAVGDGTTDDTAAFQAAITYCQLNKRKLRVPPGASATYKISSQLSITGAITIEFDHNQIFLVKAFNGDVIHTQSPCVEITNIGITGNGATYTGGGIRYFIGTQPRLTNPNIIDTADSCVIFDNTNGSAANNIVITGGLLTAHNASGQSSDGTPSIRLHGPTDTSPGNRRITDVTASTNVLLDNTGMWQTVLSGCFTGTILMAGNPNVTGITGNVTCSELICKGNYIRDGVVISGTDHVFGCNVTHGKFPIYSSYGVLSGYSSTYGWQLTTNAQNVSIGQDNEISNQIQDLSPNGLASITNKYFQNYVPFGFAWTGATADPAIGNGTFTAQTFNVIGGNIECNYGITFGSTTTLGTGAWSFSLPFWSGNAATAPAIGTWAMLLAGGTWKSGFAYLSNTGSTHRISLVDTSGVTVGSTYNSGTIPAGTALTINLFYQRD